MYASFPPCCAVVGITQESNCCCCCSCCCWLPWFFIQLKDGCDVAELMDTTDVAQRIQRGVDLVQAFDRLMAGYNSELEQTGVSTEVPAAPCPMKILCYSEFYGRFANSYQGHKISHFNLEQTCGHMAMSDPRVDGSCLNTCCIFITHWT